MDGKSFENWCAELLRNIGYKRVETTKASGDYGADILCVINGEKAVVQCKRYNKPVGIKSVQEILGARIYYNAEIMLVITNQSFTEAAIKLAADSHVHLWNRTELQNRMNSINSVYARENKDLPTHKETTVIQAPKENVSAASNKLSSSSTEPVSIEHSYEITIMRLYDKSTYILYRRATEESKALASIYRVIDVNEKVIQVKDLGIFQNPISKS